MKIARRLLDCRAALLSLLVAFSASASAQTVPSPFNSVYSIVPLGGVAGLPTSYGGLAFKDGDQNMLLVGGGANGAGGLIYAVPVIRGSGNHISGFGTPVAQGYGAFNDSGITYGPGGVLFYSKYPNNQVAQVKPGATADSAVISLGSQGIVNSPGALVFVPAGYNGANRLKISSYRDGKFYDVPYSPTGDGTFTLSAASPKATLTGGPEGLIYAPIGSPLFTNQTLLVTEYDSGKVAAYDIDAEGNPVVATRRDFITGLSGGEGAAIDPVTGDFLFTSFGTNSLFQVRGFTPPPPPATVGVTSSANPATWGTAVAFTATVTGVAPVSGTVTFKDNGADIAGCVGVALSAGSVGCATSALSVGSHTIAAYYGGNSTNSASSGSLTQTIDGLPPGTTTPPSGATSVTTGSATLQSTVSGNGLTTAASFQYGTTTAYGSTVAATPGSVGPTAVDQAVAATVSGLACGTTYHYRVQAVNSAGTSFGADSAFTTSPCPTLASISPAQGPVAGGTVVTLTGSGFGSGMAVSVAGVANACRPVTVASSTAASCVMPAGAAGAASVVVTVPGGTSAAVTYTYDSKPTLTAHSPAKGPTAGGWPITLTGTGFVAGMTVSVAGATAPCQPVTVQSQTTATCLMPPHPLGTGQVTVTTPGGTSGARSVLYLDAPEVTAISPVRGPLAGGTLVTLTGSSFFAISSITVGGVPCTSKRTVNLTEATCVTPPGTAGSADVVMTSAAGTSTPVVFTYDNVPTVTGVKPSQGPLSGGTLITMSGTSFVAGSTTVSVGGQACGSVRYLSDAKLTCVTPAGTAGAAGVVVTTPGGASAPGTFTYDDKPSITAVSPGQGPVAGGTTITVTGTSLVASRTTVTVGGAACASVAVADSTALTCVTPAGVAGVMEVVATTPGGASAPGYYTYDDVPMVTAVSPDQGPVTGGTVITLTGTAFVSGSTTVSVGGAACTGVTVASATSLECTTPAGTAGVKDVTVTTPGGTSAPLFFTYDNQPVLKSVKPSQGPVAGGTTITLTGASFIAGATTVSVGGAACGAVAVSGDKALTCVTPAGAAGTVDVTVTTAGGTSAPVSFAYDDLPVIGAISPDQGPAAGGTTITLTGTSFVAGVTTVSVGGAACSSESVTSSTSLTCVTPAGAAGVATVTVTTPGGTSNALDFAFEPIPTLVSVVPAAGPAAGGTVVTVTGTGFRVPGTTVTVGGAPCTGVSVTSATSLICTTPPRTAGALSVVATTAGGSSNSLTFTYDPVPGLATVTPVRGPAAGGTTITLGGSGFVGGGTSVTVGGQPCTSLTVTGSSSLTCVTPPGTAGTIANIVATTPGGTGGSISFTYDPVPVVSAVSPTNGPVAGGTAINVSGAGFIAGATTVQLGGVPCTGVAAASATSLSCVAPAGSPGAVSVLVFTPGGGSNAGVFTYEAVPTLGGINPAAGPTAGGTLITVTGSGFVANATTVTVGSNACIAVTVSSATSLTCVTPAGAAGTVNVVVTTPGGITNPLTFTYGGSALVPNPSFIDFGGQSLLTSTPAVGLTFTNIGSAGLTVSSIVASSQFSVSHDCGVVAPAGKCTANVVFTPQAVGPVTGSLTIAVGSASSTVALSGIGERSLITHFYQQILRRRPPDAAGKAFWEGEVARAQALGMDLNESWRVLGDVLFGSAEYAAFQADNARFVRDLYATFLNRAPEQAGVDYWSGQLAQGMPREVVLVSFMFSPEYASFTQRIFGVTSVRAEIDLVTDFYRGFLGRLPDDQGFRHWLQVLRTAQCQGGDAVNAQVESISGLFALSPEYTSLARTNDQYVGDLYNTFLRRGGDLAGVLYWINEIASGARTREQVRRAFVASPEFQARVAAVVAQGCFP